MQFQKKLKFRKILCRSYLFIFGIRPKNEAKNACRVKLACRLKQVDAAATRVKSLFFQSKKPSASRDSRVSAILAESSGEKP